MREIRLATHQNIQQILSSEPKLKASWEKTMERMERNKRIPRKQPRRSPASAEMSWRSDQTDYPTSTAAPMMGASNLMDLLDQPFGESSPSFHDTTGGSSSYHDTTTTGGGDNTESTSSETSFLLDSLLRPIEPPIETHHDSLPTSATTASSLMDLFENIDEHELSTKQQQDADIFSSDAVVPTTMSDTIVLDDAATTTLSMPRSVSLMDLLELDTVSSDSPKEFGESVDTNDHPPAMNWTDSLDFGTQHSIVGEDEISYTTVISQGVALLASMSENQWRLLENDEEVAEVPTSLQDDQSGIEAEEELIVLDEVAASLHGVEEEELLVLDEEYDTENLIEDEGGDEASKESLLRMETMIQKALSNNLSLSTEEYNLILLQLASTSVYEKQDAIDMLMQVYTHMNSFDVEASPDGFTYAIVIPALSKKGEAPIAASKIIIDLVHADYLFDNNEALVQAMTCLESCKRLEPAEKLVRHILSNDEERMTFPVEAIMPLLRMYKAEQKVDDAMDLIDDFILEAGFGQHMDELFTTVLSWPRWSSNGERVNIQTLHTFLFNKLKSSERDGRSTVEHRVWKRLVMELAKSAAKQGQSMETQLIQEIMWLLLKGNPSYWPDTVLLKHGLEVAARHDDSKLALELLQRLLARPQPMHQYGFDELGGAEAVVPETMRSIIPPQALPLAMQICVAAKDSASITSLLTMLNHPDLDIPDPLIRQTMDQAVRGFAGASNWDEARATLNAMGVRGLVPSDEAFGAVIHSLALAKNPSEALQLFKEIENGEFGDAKPGLSSYNSKMLALMQLKAWQDVIELQREMKQAGLPSSSVAFHGVILASMRLGDEGSVVEAIEDAIKLGVSLNHSCFDQSLKCLFPDLVVDRPSIPEIRLRLRERVDTASNDELGKAYLNLLRSLRVAEVEEEREVHRNVRQADIDTRRQTAWEKAHASLVQLYRSSTTYNH